MRLWFVVMRAKNRAGGANPRARQDDVASQYRGPYPAPLAP